MRHLKAGRKLNRTSSHRKALMINLATSLFEHKRIQTTEAKAKELRPFAEKIISKAKNAIAREKQGLLPDGQTVDVHNRREIGRFIKNKEVLKELFETIAPAVESRPGGYTRVVKTFYRRGDGGSSALIELVDWSGPQDGPISLKGKKKKAPKTTTPAKPVAEQEAENLVDQSVIDEATASEEVVETQVETIEAEVAPETTAEVAPEETTDDTANETSEEKSEQSDDDKDKNVKSE